MKIPYGEDNTETPYYRVPVQILEATDGGSIFRGIKGEADGALGAAKRLYTTQFKEKVVEYYLSDHLEDKIAIIQDVPGYNHLSEKVGAIVRNTFTSLDKIAWVEDRMIKVNVLKFLTADVTQALSDHFDNIKTKALEYTVSKEDGSINTKAYSYSQIIFNHFYDGSPFLATFDSNSQTVEFTAYWQSGDIEEHAQEFEEIKEYIYSIYEQGVGETYELYVPCDYDLDSEVDHMHQKYPTMFIYVGRGKELQGTTDMKYKVKIFSSQDRKKMIKAYKKKFNSFMPE